MQEFEDAGAVAIVNCPGPLVGPLLRRGVVLVVHGSRVLWWVGLGAVPMDRYGAMCPSHQNAIIGGGVMLLLRSLLGLVRLRQSSQPSRHSCTPSSIKLTPGQRAMWLGRLVIPACPHGGPLRLAKP